MCVNGLATKPQNAHTYAEQPQVLRGLTARQPNALTKSHESSIDRLPILFGVSVVEPRRDSAVFKAHSAQLILGRPNSSVLGLPLAKK